MTNKSYLIKGLLAAFLCLSFSSRADLLVSFDFAGAAGNETTSNANLVITGINAPVTISRGGGLTLSANADRFNAQGWGEASAADALANGDYFEWTVTPGAGQSMSITQISFQVQRSNTGASNLVLRTSVDSYAADLNSLANFAGNNATVLSSNNTSGVSGLQSVNAAVTFRVLGWTGAAGGAMGFEGTGNDIRIWGSVVPDSSDPVTNVHFVGSSATVGEGAGTHMVTIVKTLAEGNVSGEIVLGGTAALVDDYTIDTTNFTMNGATTSATFTITINDDGDTESAETVTLTLANVTGGTVSAPSAYTLTITDNDAPPPAPASVWINEINYDPPGTDTGEYVEVAGPVDTDLSAYRLILYNGNGGAPYNTLVLSGTIDEEGCGYGAVAFVYANGTIQNGEPDGVALAKVDGGITSLVQFLSYEGQMTGVGGVADGVLSENIGATTNLSLQLIGTGTNYADFTWTTGEFSQGSLNAGQTIDPCVAGDPVTNVRFTASADTVAESVGVYNVTVTKSLAEGNVSGQISLGGSATIVDDYSINTTNFTMNGATTSATFTITVVDDGDVESSETVTLTLVNVTGGTIVSPSVFTLTITDNDVVPETPEGILAYRFSSAPHLVASTISTGISATVMSLTAGTIETNITTGDYFPNEPYVEESGGWTASEQSSAKAFRFTITPDEGLSVTITAISFRAYATAAGPSAIGYDVGGLATHSEDMPVTNLVVVNQAVSGVANQTAPILIHIQGWTNGSRSTAGSGTFRLDDVVVYGTISGAAITTNVRFTASADTVAESVGVYNVTVTKSLAEGNVSGQISLGGSATIVDDYSINTTNFTMDGATTSATFTITVVDDETDESDETVVLTLVNVSGGTISSPSVFTLTITDNDVPPPPAGVIAYYTFTGSNRAPEFVAANANASSVSVSVGSTAFGSSQSATWTGSGVPYLESTGGWTNQTEQSLAKHFLITVDAASGYVMTITNISMLYRVTAAGPPGIGVAINDVDLDAISTGADTTFAYSVSIAGYDNITSAAIKVQGWDDSSRASTGGGGFRIDDVLVQGYLTLDGGGPITVDQQEIIAFTMPGGIPTVTLGGSQIGITYTLRYTTNLFSPQVWTQIGLPTPGTGGMLIFIDPTPTVPFRAYNVNAFLP